MEKSESVLVEGLISTIKVGKLKVNEEYRKLLPPLPPAEYGALENSIRENGLYVPLVVNPEGVVLDGNHRYKACMELKIEPKYEVRKFDNPLEEKKFVIESNLTRRHLNTFQRIEVALPLIEIERELAKNRKLSTLKKGNELPDTQNFGERGESLKIIADRIGVSHEILRQALYVMEHASEDDLEKLRSGERKISSLYKEVKGSMEKKAGDPAKRVSTRVRALLGLSKPPHEEFVEMGRYKNTQHTIYTFKKPLQEKVERVAEVLKTTPHILLQNVVEELARKVAVLKREDIEAL